MNIGYCIVIGGFLGAVCGAVFGACDVLIHYGSPHNRHHELYPLPVAIGNVAAGVGMMGIVPGAIIGGITGLRLRSIQARRQEKITQYGESRSDVWPPPPVPPLGA